MSEYLLASVHGVSSDTVKLKKLADDVAGMVNYNAVVAINYGEQQPLKALDKQTRFLIFNNVSLGLSAARAESRETNGAEPIIDVIAHSFGTLSVVRALHESAVRVRHLVLLGSIVDRWHNWDPLVRQGFVKCPPLNIVRPFDTVVRFARLFGGDRSGARGFSPQGKCQAIDHFVEGGHNDYTDDARLIAQFLSSGFSFGDAIQETHFLKQLSRVDRVQLQLLRAARLA